jgi:GTP:adenosylcobinamide-phosphate guanylyltransferase
MADGMMRWTAVVLAGSRPGVDPFAAEHGTDLKALIPVGGVPMVLRPVEALLSSGSIADVHVLAQDPQRIAEVLPSDARVRVRRSGATIAETLLAFCADPAVQWPLLVTTADHALLDAEMIRDFCSRTGRCDIAIGVVERRQLARKIGDAQRTWVKFRGGAYSGANLFAFRDRKVAAALELWRGVEKDRKKALKLLWKIGPTIFWNAVLGRKTLDETLRKVSRRVGVVIRAVEPANPLAAIDVDKTSDLQLVEQILAARA